MKRGNKRAARFAFLFVLVVIAGAFFWWLRNRPSYLLYKANRALANGNQSEMVSQYRKLLQKKGLPKDEEIRLRKALGKIYLQTFQNSYGVSSFFSTESRFESPYIELGKKEYDRVLDLDPNDSVAHYYLGRILWFRRLEAYAMDEFEKSRRADPTNAEPVWFLAEINMDRNNATAARELALQALAIAPGFDRARKTLMNAYAALGDADGTIRQYEQLSPQAKSDPELMASYALFLSRQNRWAEAANLINDAARIAPKSSDVHLTLGRMALDTGSPEEASGHIQQAGNMAPDSVWPRVYKTDVLAQRGQCTEAALASDPLINTWPQWSWSHLMSAWTNLCEAKPDRAVASINEALRLAPEFQEATFLKAQILIDQMKFDELGNVVKTLLDGKRHQSAAYAYLSQSFLLQGKRDLAQEMADAAIKLNQRNAAAFAWLGLTRARLKDKQGATWALNMAADLRPFDAMLQGTRAFALAHYFKDEAAAKELETVLSKNRRNPDLWILWGDLNRLKKNFAEAAAAYQNAAALKPYSLRAQLGVIESAFESGQLDRADVALGAALAINSKHSDVLAWRVRVRASR